MTLPKKGTRRIEIHDRVFRWLLKDAPVPEGGDLEFDHVRLTVQEDNSRPGRVMQANLRTRNLYAAVEPHDVIRLVSVALLRGWDPHDRGGPFKLEGPMDLETYEVV